MEMAVSEEPILSRLDRLDNVVRRLEEMRGCGKSPKSSCASTPSSGTLTSEWQTSSVDLSPKSLEKLCRPIKHVIKVTELKGSLLHRMDHMEDRVLNMEMEMERERERNLKIAENKKNRKKGFKQLVRGCIGGDVQRQS